MTDPPPDTPTLERGRKLIGLYRRGVGGERTNAGRLLLTHLRTHDLTLYDLDPSLPVTQEIAALDQWRESGAMIARLGAPDIAQDERDDLLTRLVDADDLSDSEMHKLIGAVSLNRLLEARVDGWAHEHGGQPQDYRLATAAVRPEALMAGTGSLARRLLAATLQAHHDLTHPERTIRADSPLQQQFLAGVIESLTGQPATLVEGGVRARLNVEQLARTRALLAQHSPQAEQIALQAALQFGRTLK